MKVVGQCERKQLRKVCRKCGALLEITHEDSYSVFNEDFKTYFFYTKCPVCHNELELGSRSLDDVFPWVDEMRV